MKVTETSWLRKRGANRNDAPCGSFEGRAAELSGPGRGRRAAESGVALVITLILLSVITFMAVTFLVVSYSERRAVGTDTDQLVAKFAMETALERAKAELLAKILYTTNSQVFDLIVSTNYQAAGGFTNSGPNVANPLNVSYVYANGNPLTPADQIQNIANLLYSPRAPVYMTNRLAGTYENRFYIDVNRNGRFDTNGLQPEIDALGGYYDLNHNSVPKPIDGNTLSNYYIGDPEWIGQLEKAGYTPGNLIDTPFPLGFSHSGTNRFSSRYAFMVVPEAKTLDINFAHNNSKNKNASMNPPGGDGFLRNQGVGTWEINLGAFLADLNTNFWNNPSDPYIYSTNPITPNKGKGFEDALYILAHRYKSAPNFVAVSPFNPLYSAQGNQEFNFDGIDGYSAGPLMVGNWQPQDSDASRIRQPWAGADNPTHIFSIQEIFDRNLMAKPSGPPPPSPPTFSDRLSMAGTNVDSYNRNTYFRLLSQLGTDSAPEPPRIHLNYANVDAKGNIVPNMQTNFLGWDPAQFMTNSVVRMLEAQFSDVPIPGFTTNLILNGRLQIQVWPTNYYTPAVHRIFQLAANIYDATTNRLSGTGVTGPDYPTVFRPVFSDLGGSGQVYLTGLEELKDASYVTASTNTGVMLDPADWSLANPPSRITSRTALYGFPLIIGAKKGVPNFNKFAMDTLVQITRKLEFLRPNTNSPVNETNQMFTVMVSNVFGMEAWNSYSNVYPRNLQLVAAVDMTATVTNEIGTMMFSNRISRGSGPTTIAANTWAGFNRYSLSSVPYSFRVPFPPKTNNFYFLTNSTYSDSLKQFIRITGQFERGHGFYLSRWWLRLNNRVRFALVDPTQNRIIDYVNLSSSEEPYDLTDMLMRDNQTDYGQCDTPYRPASTDGSFWCTNRDGGSLSLTVPTFGIKNQIGTGLGIIQVTDDQWQRQGVFLPGLSKDGAINFFRVNMGYPAIPNTYRGPLFLTNRFYAPFVPTRNFHVYTSWQANDPLVHYTPGDLVDLENTNRWETSEAQLNKPVEKVGRQLNDRYEPWTDALVSRSSSKTRFDLSLKDPGVAASDDWQFPTNKFPSIGWLGRVHRGTPWQTIYLKAPVANRDTWMKWCGDGRVITNLVDLNNSTRDSDLSQPWRDRLLLDMFTTSFNENSSRGQLNINQTNLAAWSAVLSGVLALSNSWSDTELSINPPPPPTNIAIEIKPAGIFNAAVPAAYPPLLRIVNSINDVRAKSYTNSFQHLGDILAVPELTVGPTNTYVGTAPNGYWTGISPFLNPGNLLGQLPTKQQKYGLTDAAYERIPQQILGLLKFDNTPRFAIYAYGQALKPADHSVQTSGRFFGMPTNYQIVAETAVRAIVRIDGAPKNPHAVVESYNVLPPE